MDVLADNALQHIAGVLDRAVEVDCALMEYLAATEGHQHVAYYRVLVAHTVDH